MTTADVRRARPGVNGGPTPDTGAGPGLPADVTAIHGQPFTHDRLGFVIRFDFPWDDDGPRYACPHPDPPHDWAYTAGWGLGAATVFDTYPVAARVLDYEYGRRARPSARTNGHYGHVAIHREEVHALTGVAHRAVTDLDAEIGRC